MKAFKDLQKGDKIYTFDKDDIGIETVVEVGKKEMYNLDNSKKGTFCITTNKTTYPLYYHEENGNIYVACNFSTEFGLSIMATSVDTIKNYILKRRQEEIDGKKKAMENFERGIKLFEEFLDNFYTARDKNKALKKVK